ncbi:polysaccharide pyruvyl transferase CsaB [Oceanobacillus massiliensis]|uniref:polysaccharide pyruvyl transferase CsaB n=1 Tax=Oceanobacillus massiliensis TaxID=1465765 RepID=UPI00028920D5|nr:polysaccharide pyruvyl transferase CsaB [Oceanobacillus massiliensis]
MHVVISGYYGFDNVGDEAILFSIILALKNIQPDIQITVLSNNPDATKETYKVNAVNRLKIHEVSRAIRNSDGLISGGGSLLQDATGIKSIPYYTGIIKIAKWHRKPVFIYAQGIGPIRRKLCKWIVRNTLQGVEGITVRDKDSQSLLLNLGVKQQSSIVPDPVMILKERNYVSQWLQSQNWNKPFISVSVRNWSSDTGFKRKLAICLDRLALRGYTIVFVPMHGKHDERASRETASFMSAQSYISPGDSTINEKIAIIGMSKLLIGMRLHSLIFSAINYIPFIAISYDPKIDSFAEICEQTIVGHVEKKDWDEDKLYKAVISTLANESDVKEILKNNVNPYKEMAFQTAEKALQTFSLHIESKKGDKKWERSKFYS